MEYLKPEVKHGIVHRYPTTTRFRYNGWPSVCIDDRGVLYAVASSMRITHVDPTGKNCMWVSLDQGEKWSPTIVINDSYYDDRDTGITYLGNGKLIVTWFSETVDDHYQNMLGYDWLGAEDREIVRGFSNMLQTLSEEELKNAYGSYVMVSEDYGMTWKDPVRVLVSTPHGVSKCKDGSLIYLGNCWQPPEKDWIPGRIALITSRDDGATWELTGTVPVPPDCDQTQMHEPHVIELPDGRFLGAIRIHGRPEFPHNTIYTTFSEDKGKTWSVPECIGVDGLPPHLLLHSSGAIICSYSCRTDGIRSEHAAVSYDFGKTWEEDYLLDDRIDKQLDMGYPCTAELPDGSLITVYYQAYPGDAHTSVLSSKWKLRERNAE